VKRILVVASVLAALLAAGVFWGLNRLDAAVADLIETTATSLLGTDVSVRGVDVDLREGSATLRGLRVANPRGEGLSFSAEPAFELGRITVAIDLGRLDVADPLAAPLPLRLIEVMAPVANAEVTAGGMNLDVLRRNATSSGGEAGSPVRLDIARFRFAEGRLRVDSTAVGGAARELALPPLELRNLRGTPDVVGRRLLDAFLGAAVRQVARDELSSRVDERLGHVKEKAVGALRSLLGVDEKQ